LFCLIPNEGSKYGFRLYNDEVPQSRGILIHLGNKPSNTIGCLLPGSSIKTNFVGGSGTTVKRLVNYFKQVGFKGATITILDPKHP
jgi:hypothetical protein